ncbi:MAG: hypothetical protein MUO72_17750 [Bacteroidales bacterium]|nr:hypothetical protein [Bacteroidales bacterium]
MTTKLTVKAAVYHPELLSVAEFSRKFEVSKPKVYQLIGESKLNLHYICGIPYIDITERAVLDQALSYKSRHQGDWARGGTSIIKKLKSKPDTWEAAMDLAWIKDQEA